MISVVCYKYIFRLFISVVLGIIKSYICISNIIMNILPTYIYMGTYIHKVNDLDFSVHHYRINYNNKYINFKVIEDNDNIDYNNVLQNINDDDIKNINIINHCCILSMDGEYIKDITKDIRMFIHYLGKIKWVYILEHLDECSIDKKIVVYMNDDELTERVFNMKDIVDEIFDFN